MNRVTRRSTRRSGSGLEQINGECSGAVNPTVDIVSEQSNTSAPINTSEAVGRMENLEETPNVATENVRLHDEVMENGNDGSNGFSLEEQKPTCGTRKMSSNMKTKISGSHRKLVLALPCRGQFEVHRPSRSFTSSKRLGGGGERKVMFPRHKKAQKSKEAAASSSVDATSTPAPKKRKNNMNQEKVREENEYTRIKKNLRYLLNRIRFEQNLIDAYSLEGWKGSSAEKLRPEKELERANKEILRRKVKIRDLIQHLDTLCAEGSLPESLFDSDGQISSEDIFCAKCGSMDLSVDNDIILCDGFCDRGFHQYCVEPPLRKEDIPPDDEAWLCPGCDCKDYSFDLLNDSLGTKFSVSDSWEKIFPEAAVALAGGDQNLNCDLPSDDSDDEEYDPDGLNDKEKDEDGSDDSNESENEDGSCGESGFSSASDKMIGSIKEVKDIMNLPSDDSEDDDYDPDGLKDNENDEDGSDDSDESENEDGGCDESGFSSAPDEMIGSIKEVKDIMDLPSDDSEDDDYDPDAKIHDANSDSTSDSADLETSFKGDESNQQDEVSPLVEPGRKRMYDAISESDAKLDDGLVDVPKKRNVERLDYKKLYDEEYENASSSSSDDEDWDKIAGEDLESADEGNMVPLKQYSNAKDHTSTRKLTESSKMTDEKDTLEAQQEAPRENGCSGVKSSSSAFKKTDPKTQRLYTYFEENQYPDKTTRENLAKELQMTVTQVNNWFKNRRSSMSSKQEVKKLKTGETSVAGSSNQTKKTESVTEKQSRPSEATNPGSSKRRRK